MADKFWGFLKDKKEIYWKGYYREDRYKGINEIEKRVNQVGFITDFKMFSDLEICFRIELEEKRIDELYTALHSILDLDDFEKFSSESNIERVIFLNVTFLKSTGDMKIEGPIGPG